MKSRRPRRVFPSVTKACCLFMLLLFPVMAAATSLEQCAAFNPGKNSLAVPCVGYGGTDFSVDMQLTGTDPYRLEVTSAGPPSGAGSECASYDPLTRKVDFPCVEYGGAYFRVSMDLYSMDPYRLEVTSAEYSPLVVVTVDGLDFVNTLLDRTINEPDDYLYSAVSSMNFAWNIIIHPFRWSRNAMDTDKTVRDLRAFLRNSYALARQNNARLAIVSHSWGTFLTYIALAEESGGKDPVVCHLFLTLGSPLGTFYAAEKDDRLPSADEQVVVGYVNYWLREFGYPLIGFGTYRPDLSPKALNKVNFWARGDLISGPLKEFLRGTEDVLIDAGARSSRSRSTTEYWHLFDSLQPMKLNDNSPLKEEIRSFLIRESLRPETAVSAK